MERSGSPRLHPQIHAREEGARTTSRIRRRRGASPPAAASLPDDDDMLREILLRLPPQPSSLPRASAVCRRWRGLVTDTKFQRQFYAHHRKPPFLGVFACGTEGIVFTPVLDPPDRIPPQRFDLGRCRGSGNNYYVLDCRHGLVLVTGPVWDEVVVCDPITGEQCRLSVPPEFKAGYVNGAVLCAAAGDLGHVHGACHSSPFKVVLMSMYRGPTVRVYSSETGVWGNIISTEATHKLGGDASRPATLVGNSLYWLSRKSRLLEFHLDAQRLAVTMGPPVSNGLHHGSCQLVQAEDGAVGFAILSYPRFQMWQRNVNGHGVAPWVPWKTIEMDSILGLPPQIEVGIGMKKIIRGYDEDNDVIFLRVNNSVHMLQLKSMQSRKLHGNIYHTGRYYPFRSFYTPAIRECDEADMLRDP